MDGYVIADAGTDVDLGNGVRHIAYLESGEIFVAFDGERPCAGALLIAEDGFLGMDRIRRKNPFGGDGIEAFYLLGGFDAYRYMAKGIVTAATLLTSGNVLVMTDGTEIPDAIWGSKAITWVDTRVPEPVG